MRAKIKPKIILNNWTGPVSVDGNYYHNLDEAIEQTWDNTNFLPGGKKLDISSISEYAEACFAIKPEFDAQEVIDSIDNKMGELDIGFFSEFADLPSLQKVIDRWIMLQNFYVYESSNQFIEFRSLVIAYDREQNN
jgi:hypothetical protein